MHNPFWLGTPHMSTEDFEYQGMHIPKNTVVILNAVSSPCIRTGFTRFLMHDGWPVDDALRSGAVPRS